MSLKEKLFQTLKQKEPRMIEIRRYLHENPELSFKEYQTAKYIADFYNGKDCSVRTGVGGNGVVVTIDSGKPGRTAALRADFDALPIQEDTGLPFSSKVPGVMHACGHDAHTAYMLILAETLIELKDEWSGKIVILHQHAEELPPGGAKSMIADGCLDGVDNVFGLHLISNLKNSTVYYHAGAVHTGQSSFKIDLYGKGGHGAMPQDTHDTILAASDLVVSLQSIVSRRVDPFDMATLTVGRFEASGAPNIVNAHVLLEGDIRTLSAKVQQLIEVEFKRVLEGIATMYNVTYDLDYRHNYPVTVNDEKLTAFVEQSLKSANIPEIEAVLDSGAQGPSEDFAYYAKERPSCYFHVGAAAKDGTFYPHHNPKFMIDENSMLIAAKAMGNVVVDYLNE
jgi:amidohydrolase